MRLEFIRWLWYFYLLPLCLAKGIKTGSGIKFYGRAFFFRDPKATIQLGKKNVLRSISTSNMIGVNRPCMFTAHLNGKLIIGDNCGFSGTVIGAFSEIVLGDNIRCGANTLITDSDWHNDDARSSTPRRIIIEDNVWIGEGVKILKGVTIGRNTVIGSGSVVTKSLPPNVIAAGNPCKVIREINT
ncbi:MAG: acyltransferase [Bacteroidota bacterium]